MTPPNDTLSLQIQESQVSESDAAVLQNTFAPLFVEAQQWRQKAVAITVTGAEDRQGMAAARKARLALKDIRVQAEHARKKLKEESLRKGKAIDGMANIIKFLIVPLEEHLERQENFAKVQEEKAKQERKEWRERALRAVEADTTLHDLAEMPEDAYAKLLADSQAALQAKKEAEEKAERERIAREKAAAEERERLGVENERLKREAEEREREAATEREAKERAEAELRAKKQEEERVEREKADAERRRIERERQAQLAPDKEKLMQLAGVIAGVPIPVVSSDEATAVVNKAIKMLAEASEYVKTRAATL